MLYERSGCKDAAYRAICNGRSTVLIVPRNVTSVTLVILFCSNEKKKQLKLQPFSAYGTHF